MLRSSTRFLKALGTGLLFLVIALMLAITFVPPFLDFRYYEGGESTHFDGDYFFNPDGRENILSGGPPGGRSRMLARMITGDDRPDWPVSVPVSPTRPHPRVEGDRMVATWVGHATVLVQTQGLNILTDPIWSDVAGPFNLVGPRRVVAPGIRFEDLPKIDLILVSHNHYDHMDLATLKRLWTRDRPQIVTSLGNDAVIAQAGVPAKALDWGGTIAVRPGIQVAVTRNHHWGSRWFTDRNRALWSSFVVTLPGGNLFFAGDTGPGDLKWPVEAARLGAVRLALLPIGAFRFQPGQLGTPSHIGPMDAVKVFEGLGATTAIPIHWGAFRLSNEAYDTPPRMLELFSACAGLHRGQFVPHRIGAPFEVPPYADLVKGVAVHPERCRPGSAELAALK